MATAAEIAGMDSEELEMRLNETRRELFNLRFQLATGQLDDPSRLPFARKDIARILTELRAREIAEAEGLALDELPSHRAAARQQAEDSAAGRVRTTSEERAETRRAAAEARRATAAGETDDEDDDAADEAIEEELLDEDDIEAEVLEAEMDADDETEDEEKN